MVIWGYIGVYICIRIGVTKLGYLGICRGIKYRGISGFRGLRLRIHRSQSFRNADDDNDGVGM